MNSAKSVGIFILMLLMKIYANVSMGSELFCDHMVLQREKPVRVWGAASDGEQVTVSVAGQTKSTTASGGEWEVMLDAMDAGGPYEMTVEGSNTLTFTDVLVGEVIFGGGQSNMVVYMVHDELAGSYAQAAETADYPEIRISQHSWYPWEPSSGSDAYEGYQTLQDRKWHVCTPLNVKAFSAIMYYIGKKVHEEFDVPVGVITRGVSAQSLPPFLPALDESQLYERELIELWRWRIETGLPEGLDVMRDSSWHTDGKWFDDVKTVLPYTMRTIVWWQGENEMKEYFHYEYRYRYTALISAWRRIARQGTLPFIAVTEPNGGGWENQPWYCPNTPWEGDTLPYGDVDYPHRTGMMYETYPLSLDIQDVYMASAVGLGGGSHPGQKKERAERVKNVMLEKIFGRNIISEPPLYDSYSIEQGNKMRITYRGNTGDGLYAEGGEVKGFCINSESDSTFVYAQAQIDGADVLVWNDNISDPKAVRYGWTGKILECATLCNSTGLQAYPFRTDVEPLPTDFTSTAAPERDYRRDAGFKQGLDGINPAKTAVYDVRGRLINWKETMPASLKKNPSGAYIIPYTNNNTGEGYRIIVKQ
ncbi:MAG: hypothetical protein GF401_00885 [Chitinivibrionales bacterium]|nr:hypothetical protein [Chitinivibrionales bacterium]